jgi:integrase
VVATLALGAATLVVALVAALQDRIRGWFWRPKLELSITSRPPDSHKTVMNLVSQTGVIAQADCYYLRLLVSNVAELRPRTRERYETSLDRHLRPRFGRRQLATITEDDVAALIADMRTGIYFTEQDGRLVERKREKGYAPWTIRGVLVPLSRVFSFAVRRGYLAVNPVSRLERGERPRVGKRERRVLDSAEIPALLGKALPGYRTLLAAAVYTGLRQSELLGLRWENVDFAGGFVRVRHQLDRSGGYVEPKTLQAVRDVVLAPALARLRHRRTALARGFARATDPVFANAAGGPFQHRNVQVRGFDKAAARARINVEGGGRRKATFHDLRHTFASLLIAHGADVVHVSRQLGHADPAITLRVYADEFAAADHAERTRALLDAAVGNTLEAAGDAKGPAVRGVDLDVARSTALPTVRRSRS